MLYPVASRPENTAAYLTGTNPPQASALARTISATVSQSSLVADPGLSRGAAFWPARGGFWLSEPGFRVNVVGDVSGMDAS